MIFSQQIDMYSMYYLSLGLEASLSRVAWLPSILTMLLILPPLEHNNKICGNQKTIVLLHPYWPILRQNSLICFTTKSKVFESWVACMRNCRTQPNATARKTLWPAKSSLSTPFFCGNHCSVLLYRVILGVILALFMGFGLHWKL